jgi:hypothetical protein
MIIRDFYFAAWLIELGITYKIEKGKLHLDIDSSSLNKYKKTYTDSDKTKFDRVRNLIKEINENRNLSK